MTTLTPPSTIAFIGLGMMGRPMAKRLVEAGFTLRVFDVSQKAVSDFVGAHPSALATASAKAAAQGAAALITMLPDGKIVRQAVLEGQDPAIEGLEAGAVDQLPVGLRETLPDRRGHLAQGAQVVAHAGRGVRLAQARDQGPHEDAARQAKQQQ